MTAWRICKPKYEKSAFDGAGAASYPGRWNKHGQHVVYVSDTPSLAVLEIVVNATASLLPLYCLFSCSFDEALVTEIGILPAGWQRLVDPNWYFLQELGSEWYESRRSAVLRVPSAVISYQSNYILNVRHPDFSKITIGPPVDLESDPRLIKT
ncbi:MAG: RES family NAD+ phosphorylase [Rectinemataceae bacterium]